MNQLVCFRKYTMLKPTSKLFEIFACCSFVLFAASPTQGISSIQISPPLSQNNWALNYAGPLYAVTIDSVTSLMDLEWIIDVPGSSPVVLNFTSSECSNVTMTSPGGISATCSDGKEAMLTADQPLTSGITVTFKASGASFEVELSTQLSVAECQLNRTSSNAVAISSTPCGYNCTVTFTCIMGYTSITDGADSYTARCSEDATFDPPELCIPKPENPDSGPGLNSWLIAGIVIGCVAAVWFCPILLF